MNPESERIHSLRKYVGIRNWPEKAQLLQTPNFTFGHIETDSVTFDCERHVDFLSTYMEKGDRFDPAQTLYYAFYDYVKGPGAAVAQCSQFLRMFTGILQSGLRLEEAIVSVCDNGARLDGSHRSAIARILGINRIPARIYSWDGFSPAKVAHISKEVDCKTKCRSRNVGRRAFEKKDKKYLGKVMYTEMFPLVPRIPWHALAKKLLRFETVVALKTDLSAAYVPEREVFFLDE